MNAKTTKIVDRQLPLPIPDINNNVYQGQKIDFVAFYTASGNFKTVRVDNNEHFSISDIFTADNYPMMVMQTSDIKPMSQEEFNRAFAK